MLNIKRILSRHAALLLILTGLAVAVSVIIYQGGDEFVVPTAVGDTHNAFTESDDFQHLDRANRAFINLVKRTRPSIVQITTFTERKVDETIPRFNIFPNQDMDRDQLRRFMERFRSDRNEEFRFEKNPIPNNQLPVPQSVGIGSGVIISGDGYILTNNHVVDKADEILVTLSDGKEYDAELIGTDPSGSEVSGTDLAVLKIKAEGLPELPFGDSDTLEVGEWVIAIGTPFNLSQTVTRGVVSAKNRPNNNIKYANFIQTDTPINHGNSGGALINIRGELVGINTLIATNGIEIGNVGIGFAIPSNTARQLLPQLIEHGKIVRGWLGISMASVSHDLAEKLKLDEVRGAVVNEVGRGSPADKAGLRHGDVILEFDGQTVRDSNHLMHLVGSAGVGAKAKMKVLRNNKEIQLSVKLDERTEEAIESLEKAIDPDVSPLQLAGMHVQSLTPKLAQQYGHQDETGVIVMHVDPSSTAYRNGIRAGYLIKEIDYNEIKSLEDYEAIVEKLSESNETLALVYFKDIRQRGRFVTLRIR